MTVLEFFEKGYALVGVKLGLISTGYLSKYDMYLTYTEYLEKLSNLPEHKAIAQAKKLTMIHYNADYYEVRRAIICFESDLQISVNNLVS